MRTRLTVVAALVVFASVVGVRALTLPAAEPQLGSAERKPPAKPAPPDGPPQYVGVIEQVKVSSAPTGRPVVRVLVRHTLPGGRPGRVWAHLDNATLEQRGAQLEVGSAASVWAKGDVDVPTTIPPQVWAVYIVCEPAGK